MHHAVEMFLKGYLSDYIDDKALRKLDHNLPKIWKQYKQRIGDASLDRFDAVVDELHKFDAIRYPDGTSQELSIGWGKVDLNAGKGPIFPEHPMRRYHLSVGAIDELVQVIFTSSGVPPTMLDMAVWWPETNTREYLYMKNVDHLPPKSR